MDKTMENLKTRTDATFTAANGETVSYNEIFDGIRKSVEVYGNTNGGELSAQDLEDIFQNSAYKALRYAGSFNPAKEGKRASAKTYGSRIAQNCCKDAIQRYKRDQSMFTPFTTLNQDGDEIDEDYNEAYAADGCYAADYEMESNEALDRINSAIASLSENYRLIILLQQNGVKPEKMAEEIGCPAGVVYTLLCRARKALKKKLGWEFLAQYGIPS